jgi:uncharacterized protein (TIGR02246 family)
MSDPETAGRGILARMEAGWNAGDGAAFSELMADDADFVDIRGDLHKGRSAIAAGHQAVLDSIYKGSQIRYELERARQVAPGVTLVHVSATLNCPAGPMAGVTHSMISMLLAGSGNEQLIAAFHNTIAQGEGAQS